MPQIIPIRDLRDTTKLSEMCNATNEPIYVTKNGYGDLVIMSMETYETLAAVPPKEPEAMCFLTEKGAPWAGMLADVLQQHGIPFIKESSLGAGLSIKMGSLSETIRFFVPTSRLSAAEAVVEELFATEAE